MVAESYLKCGLPGKASPLMEEIVSTRERVLGRDHPDVASALSSRALLLMEQVGGV